MNRRAFLRSLCASPIAAAASVAGLAAVSPAIGAGRQYATGEGGPEMIIPQVGDVVMDRYSRVPMTVERVDARHVSTVWFDGPHLRRGRLLSRNLTAMG
jgi:hypothetical protein